MLWTETPAERQQCLADEVMGKRCCVENADLDQEDGMEEDVHKRWKCEAELQQQIEKYTVCTSAVFCPGNMCRWTDRWVLTDTN